MKHGRGILSDAEHLTHFYSEVAHKLGVSVMDEHFGESYTFEHVLQVQFSDSFCCDRFIAWYEYNGFGAIVVSDCVTSR